MLHSDFYEDVRLLVRYLFDSTLINRLENRMDTRNEASEKVAIKNGFQKEGISRGANFVRGQYGIKFRHGFFI